MRNLLFPVILVVGLAFSWVTTAAQATDPCSNLLTGDQIGVEYKGHCILVEPDKGPVQGIFVRTVEDLDSVTKEGIVIMHTDKGWVVADDLFTVDISNKQFARTAVGDAWHMTLDPVE